MLSRSQALRTVVPVKLEQDTAPKKMMNGRIVVK